MTKPKPVSPTSKMTIYQALENLFKAASHLQANEQTWDILKQSKNVILEYVDQKEGPSLIDAKPKKQKMESLNA